MNILHTYYMFTVFEKKKIRNYSFKDEAAENGI